MGGLDEYGERIWHEDASVLGISMVETEGLPYSKPLAQFDACDDSIDARLVTPETGG